MGHFDGQLGRDQGAGHGRIHIAHNDDPIRLFLKTYFFKPHHDFCGLHGMRPGTDLQIHIRIGDVQIPEESVRHLHIVVLSGMNQKSIKTGAAIFLKLLCLRIACISGAIFMKFGRAPTTKISFNVLFHS